MAPSKILLTSILTNIALTLLKVLGGLVAGSSGLVADGFHSLTDVIAMTANYFGMKISLQPANGLDAYDNYKKEILGTFIVSLALFIIGLFILVRSYVRLTTGIAHSPGLGAGLIVVVAFVITCWLYYYSRHESQQSHSPGLAVNTEQIRLNVLSTVAVLIGIGGGCFDMSWLDAVAAVVVALIIFYASVRIILAFLAEIEQARLTKKQVDEIAALVSETDADARIVRLKTMAIRKKTWLLLELADYPKRPVTPAAMERVKRALLANLLYLDNVIVGAGSLPDASEPHIEIEDFGRELTAARNFLTLGLVIVLGLAASASAFGVPVFSRECHVLLPAAVADVNGGVSRQLGRAPYFYIYRIDREAGRFIANPLAAAPADIDRSAAKLFIDYSVEAVIARNVGPYIFRALKEADIALYEAAPNLTIAQQIEQIRKGDLEMLAEPNVGVRFGLKNLRLLSPWYNWQTR